MTTALPDCELTRFAAFAHAQAGAPPTGASVRESWEALWRWSVREPARFWGAFADFAAPLADRAGGEVLRTGARLQDARWFTGMRLNLAENLLAGEGPGPALIAVDETGQRREVSRAELRAQARRVAAALAGEGVGAGDVVAGYLPTIVEGVVAMLATTSLGAVWTSCSADFGVDAVVDRFAQVQPTVLFAARRYHYAGKVEDCGERALRIAGRLPGLRTVVMVGDERADAAAPVPVVPWSAFGREGFPGFRRLPFDAPCYIVYSSGTTGLPKCIVHGIGGTLLQHLKELRLHVDLRAGERIFFFTTCGWMMWNWLVSALATGATVVLYDGSPTHPDIGALWRLAEREEIAVFGTSPRYLAALENLGYRPREHHALPRLRALLSTGAPLPAERFDFVREAIADIPVASISGGTDILSCFCLGNPWLPVQRGELQCAGLGMAVDIFDPQGRAVPEGVDGELVCTAPFPSMPVGFWNDPGGARFSAAYFERFPDAWHHGDVIRRTASGGYVIQGRSDAVLNPGGVRIGTAEIYRVVERVPEVQEALAIGQRWRDQDERVLLFVRLREGAELTPELQRTIRTRLREELSPRHVPARIIAVADLPRTHNGKLAELAVRDVVHGREVANVAALANPESLALFVGVQASG